MRRIFSSLVLVGMGFSAHADEVMPNPYDSMGQFAPSAAVMENPYDAILELQRKKLEEGTEAGRGIKELFEQTRPTSSSNLSAELMRIRTRGETVDQRTKVELMNLDTPPIEVEKVAIEDTDPWALPALSEVDGDVDTIGMVRGEPAQQPEDLFLKDWTLERETSGKYSVSRIGDPLSRIDVRVGMILGEYGRILAVRDTPDAFFLLLENGSRIQGEHSR